LGRQENNLMGRMRGRVEHFLCIAVLGALTAVAGCDPSATGSGAGGAPPTQNPFGTPSGGIPVAETESRPKSEAGPVVATSREIDAVAPQGLAIRLSAGTALPQTGPEGTIVGFSVDYRVTQGRPEPTSKFVLVVSGSGGKSVEQPLALKPEGTVEFFTPQFRPEDAPFNARIVEITAAGARRDLSPEEPLR
jgi:hypothetical protein